MTLIASKQGKTGKIIIAKLNNSFYRQGWYLTDIPLGDQIESLHYSLNLKSVGVTHGLNWKFLGKSVSYVKDKAEYREDGSIVYSNETDGYKRIWFMSLYSGNEEMAIIMNDKVLVLPSHLNKDASAKLFEYGYEEKGGKVIDALTKKGLNVVALMHTHPNGSAPSTFGGDGSFMAAHFPFKPMYVLMIKKEDISRSSIGFIVGSENPYSNETGFSGYTADLDKNLTITNLLKSSKGYLLRDFTIGNKANFKRIIPKFQKK